MHKQREDLDLLFRRTTPETVLSNIIDQCYYGVKAKLCLNYNNYSYEAYDHFAMLNFPEYSPSETRLRHTEIQNQICENVESGIFLLLYQYAKTVLDVRGNEPVCKIKEILNWNSISLRLGQDLFVTAWIAYRDVQKYGTGKNTINFSWAPIIKTDDLGLETLFEKELAENHFHHHGSTQSFSISWACLMNHPDYSSRFLAYREQFKENLNFNISRGDVDNVLSWKERLSYAALIRAMLFARCLGMMDSSEVRKQFRDFYSFPTTHIGKELAEMLRLFYGTPFEQPCGGQKCLDYAICTTLSDVDRQDSNRILSGERTFLYHCFVKQFSGEFTILESSLFYLYLLIKSNFRSELIQVNKRTGFANFSAYQNRKNQFFESMMEYWAEAQRIAVCGAIEENHLVSLETRIMPKNSTKDMKDMVEGLDQLIAFANQRTDENQGNLEKIDKIFERQFYVIHFAKKPFTKEEFEKQRYRCLPRNHRVRKDIERQAKVLADTLMRYPKVANRIRGIDACSLEIGCRPETFATEFRFLRGILQENVEITHSSIKSHRTELGHTFHAGEDFLDIIDGLRAIDEAVCFLELKKGDRLGHALALGINATEYYRSKRNNIYLTKQDYLDNLVWILYRCMELAVCIEPNHRAKMIEQARGLLMEIYADAIEFDGFGDLLDLYYQSWKLRGDHPAAYENGEYDRRLIQCRYDEYARYMLQDESDKYRKRKVVSKFYHTYHFNKVVKMTGLLPEAIVVEDWYVEIVSRLQKAMCMEIFKREIAIECNPTSNVLIGTFPFYEDHPIFVFNNHCLGAKVDTPDLCVSINTDDLGVFDTSLVNEYALLFRAIQRKRHRSGNFDDSAIYQYLERIRQNGMNMVFHL